MMFAYEAEQARNATVVTLYCPKGQSRLVPYRLADRNVLRLHGLPLTYPMDDTALRTIGVTGLGLIVLS